MGIQLDFYIKVCREKFQLEDFCGKENVLAVVQKGSFSFSSKYGSGTVGEGEALCFMKGVNYYRRVKEPVTLFLFRFTPAQSFEERGKIVFYDKERIFSTLRVIDDLSVVQYNQRLKYVEALFGDIINQIAVEKILTDKRNTDKKIVEGIKYIKENCFTGLELSLAAQAAGLSYVQFSRRFKAFTGQTPMEYVIELRMKKAQQLLAQTSLSVKEISALCGFSGEYYFSNFFKANFGMSPSAFRNSI